MVVGSLLGAAWNSGGGGRQRRLSVYYDEAAPVQK